MFFFSQSTLCIRDLELIKQLTVKDFDSFTDHINVIEPEADPLAAKNLVNMTGNEWRQMRSTLSPVFTGNKMRGMYPFIFECANNFTDYLKSNKEEILHIELKQVFTKYTSDVIANTSFGITCNSFKDKENEFYRMGKKITNLSLTTLFKTILYLIVPKIMKIFKVRVFSEEITGFFHKIVSVNKIARQDGKVYRPDMLQLLFQAQNGNLEADDANSTVKQPKYELTDEDITAQALVFFFAGFDTVSTVLGFMFLELAINPLIQEKLQQEIDKNLAVGTMDYERITKMMYLDQVVSGNEKRF